MLVPLLIAAAVSTATPPARPLADQPVGLDHLDCKSSTQAEVLVCAQPKQSYRIDKNVLDASRAHDAPPPKPPLHADVAQDDGCIGGKGCTGGVIPLVGMALVAAKAVALAANGDDWRDAIRIHEDEYRLYKAAEARKAKEHRPRIGFGVSR